MKLRLENKDEIIKSNKSCITYKMYSNLHIRETRKKKS